MQRFLSALPIRWALLLVTGLWSILAAAQSTCPELKVSDFKVNYYAANADCGTAGQIIVTYRNNVAGFSKLTYETSTDGTTWANPVEQTSLSVPTTIPLTGWAAGQTIHLRVTGTCPSGTQEVVFPTLTHRSEQPHAVAPVFETTPAGGCSATAGSIGVSVGEVSGFTKAEYFLYQGATLLNSMTSNTPYAESTFYNLPSGTYKVVMRATPACTPASPGTTFKNGAYEVEQTVKVGYFSILPTPIPTRGTCDGGVRVAVARMMGVNSIKYEVLKGGVVLQTQQLIFPNFTHTFLSLPLGSYEIRGTTDCGTVETVPFTITTGAPGTLTTDLVRNTYPDCDKGIITGTILGTTEACPVDYVLTPKSYVGTPIVKNGVTTETVTFDNLPAGYYEMQATWGGQVQKKNVLIRVVSLGDLELSGNQADYNCDPTGTITVKLKNGVYDEPMTLTLSLDGTPVRSVALSKTDREKTIENLVPGGYDISLKTECGAEITGKKAVLVKNPVNLNNVYFQGPNAYDYNLCEDQLYVTYKVRKETYDAAPFKRFIGGATYTIYRDGAIIGSGLMPKPTNPYGYEYIYSLPVTQGYGKMELHIAPSCGSPVYTYAWDASEGSFTAMQMPKLEVYTQVRTGSTSCDAMGAFAIGTSSRYNLGYQYDSKLVVKNATDNVTVLNKSYAKGSYSNIQEEVSKMKAGHYTYELTIEGCPTERVVKGEFDLTAIAPFPSSYRQPMLTPYAACNGLGRIVCQFQNATQKEEGKTYNYRLVNSAGTTVKTATSETANFTFSGLSADTYTVYASLTTPSCTSSEVEVGSTTVPTGLPSLLEIASATTTAGDLCVNNGEAEIYLQNRTSPGTYYVSGTLTWHIKDLITGADVVPAKTSTDPAEHVKFTSVPPGKYKVLLETSCGNLTSKVEITQKDYKSIPVSYEVSHVFPGCKKGKAKIIANPSAQGLPVQPIKIWVYKREIEGEPVVVDSIVSTSSISEHTFDNLPAGNYEFTYVYCGKEIPGQFEIRQITALTGIGYYAQPGGPCELGRISVQPNPMDASLTVDWALKDKTTGVVVKTLTANGGSNSYIEDVEPGNYELSAKVQGSCLNASAKQDVTMPNSQINAWYTYSSRLDCFNNGWVEMYLTSSVGRITHVQYMVQPAGGGTPFVAQSSDPKERKKFLNLPAGKYKLQVIATCQSTNGTTSQYTWNNNNREIEMVNGYTTMTAYIDDASTLPTMPCPAQGAIGLTIQNGNSYKQKVFITEDPNGPVVPEREIKPIYSSNIGKYIWGGDLPAGHYKIRIWDECMSIDRDVTIPAIPDLMKVSHISCVGINESCTKMNAVVYLDVSGYPANKKRCEIPNAYEVAIVPRGGNRTTEPWSSNWRIEGTDCSSVYLYTQPDSFPITPYSTGVDVLLRLKGCPSSVRRYPFDIVPCCPHTVEEKVLDCDRKQFVLKIRNKCNEAYDIAIYKGWGSSKTFIKEKTIQTNVVGPVYDPDFIVPTDDWYYCYIFPHGAPKNLSSSCYTYVSPISKEIFFRYSIQEHGSTCNTDKLIWLVSSGCPIKVKFKIWDVTAGGPNPVDQSPGLMSQYVSDYPYIRNHVYHIRLYDAAGNLLSFRTNNSSPLTNVHQHTVSYETPISYGPTINEQSKVEYLCSQGNNLIQLPYYFEAAYVAGTSRERMRVPPITKVEIRDNSNGDVYFNEALDWSQMPDFNNTWDHNYASVDYHKWKVRHPNGSIENHSGYVRVPGSFTSTVQDACGRTTTRTFSYTVLPAGNFSMDNDVTMDCQGKFTIKPKGTAHFPDNRKTMVFTGFTATITDNPLKTEYTAGESYSSNNPQQKIIYKFQNSSNPNEKCEFERNFDLSRYYLTMDGSSSASFFCEGSNTGDITVSLKSGNPPYTYKLLKPDGTLVDQKTAPGAVNFKTGKLGEIYRIDATDACNLTHIFQDVLLQDPKEIGYTMNRDLYFCEGQPSSFEAMNLAGATYEWKGPNGFTSTNRQLNITATTATAGTYNLKVKPATCSTTIDAVVKVNVVNVKEVGTSVEKRLCSGQSANINIGVPLVQSNGVNVTNYKYQWQLTDDPTDPNSWSGIVGATSEQLNYTPPFQGTYYVRRVTVLGSCSDYSAVSKIVADPGLNSIVSNDELNITIDHKNPFTLTAGFVTGNPSRTYQWQRSLDKTTWTNIAGATDQTYTETQRYGAIVYYKRITSAGTCSTESPIITVRFKKRYPAMVNPHLRQRVLTE